MTTDVFARGIDIERVNIVINYDFPSEQHTYLHRVGRAGRFGTKGLAISFVASEDDAKVLEEVQKRFEVDIPELPDSIEVSDYSTLCCCCLVPPDVALHVLCRLCSELNAPPPTGCTAACRASAVAAPSTYTTTHVYNPVSTPSRNSSSTTEGLFT